MFGPARDKGQQIATNRTNRHVEFVEGIVDNAINKVADRLTWQIRN